MTTVRTVPRIVVVASGRPAIGGIATFAESLASSPALRGVADVTLLNTTRVAVRTAGRLSASNVRHALVDAVRVARAARQADVVHLQVAPGRVFPLARAVALCFAVRAAGAGLVCHVHSSKINGGDPRGFTPSRTFRLLCRGLAVADAIPTVSETGTLVLRDLIPRARVETVPNAVAVDEFRVAAPGESPVVLLFVGTLCERKGLRDLAAACRRLAAQDLPPWRLEVVGGAAEVGEEEAESIREDFREAGLGDALVGPLQGRALRERFESASIFVLPSHWEGQPMVILEAMASGLPVVATRVGAVADTVRPEVDGLLVDRRDVQQLEVALARLIRDADLRVRLGAAARERARAEYDMSSLAQRLGALYENARERARR